MQQSVQPVHVIRRAIPADLDALLALETASFTTDLLTRRRLRHWIAAANGILLVAEARPRTRPAQLAGYILGFTRQQGKSARLYSLAIARAARGQGLATRLLRRAERECRKRGCSTVRLEVAQGNTGALALYDKLGYVRLASIRGYYEDGQDAWRMQKSL